MIFFRLLRVAIIISKYQLLTKPERFNLPTAVRIIGKCSEILFYPIRLIKKPLHQSFGYRLKEAFKELGPIYIKFGQTLSSSPTLVGAEAAASLRGLQDKLEPFDISYVRSTICNSLKSFPEELFDDFEETPVSAASIAQVHKAKTKEGVQVAVKILRPFIRKQYSQDIKFLRFFARCITKCSARYNRLKLLQVIDLFELTMEHELNLKLEAAAASELSDNFKKDKTIYIPKVFWHLTLNDVLTTEWIEGFSIYDTASIEKYSLDNSELARKIALIFFNQAFRDGFFHADLHPGNILVKHDGTIALVDFGIMGRLEEKERLILAEILFKFFKRDYYAVAKLHLKAGYVSSKTDLYLFAHYCRAIYEPLIYASFKEVIIADLLANLFKITKEFGMETQPQLVLLQKTMIVVEGIGRILSPEENIWQLTEPWIRKWGAKNLSPEAKLLRSVKIFLSQNLD